MLKKKSKLLLFLLIILLIYPVFIKLTLNYDYASTNTSNLFLNNIGGSNNVNSILNYLIMILLICFYSYISISTFIKDVGYGRENIFLRLSKNKWLFTKTIVIITYTIFIEIIIISILAIIYTLFGANISIIDYARIICADILSKISIQIVGMIFLLLLKKYAFPIIIIIFSVQFTLPGLYTVLPFKLLELLFSSAYLDQLSVGFGIMSFLLMCLYLTKIFLLDTIFEGREN